VLPDVLSSFMLFSDKLSAVAISALPKKKQLYVNMSKDGETHYFH
jgi:hypothetical protein